MKCVSDRISGRLDSEEENINNLEGYPKSRQKETEEKMQRTSVNCGTTLIHLS